MSAGANCGIRANASLPVLSVVQAMLRTHPYTTWPLHVKLFTRDAVKCWVSTMTAHGSDSGELKKTGGRSKKLVIIPSAAELTDGLPRGMVVTVELEGVDGSGKDESLDERPRRKGPIEVTDGVYAPCSGAFETKKNSAETFTSAHLAKQTRLLASKPVHPCSVCNEPIDLASSVSYY